MSRVGGIAVAGRWGLSESIDSWEDCRAPRVLDRIVIVGCGSSYNAGRASATAFERLAGIPSVALHPGEFRYPRLNSRTLLVAVSESGEDAETVAAVRQARSVAASVLAFVGDAESTIARSADQVRIIPRGPAGSFPQQVLNLSLLALSLGRTRGGVPARRVQEVEESIRRIPMEAERVLNRDIFIRNCARKYQDGFEFLFFGSRHHAATAREAALRMNEVAGVPLSLALEVGNGKLAWPVNHRSVFVAIAPQGDDATKMISLLEEIRERGGIVLSVATEDDRRIADLSDHVLEIPECEEALSPVLAFFPLQLLASHRAAERERELADSELGA